MSDLALGERTKLDVLGDLNLLFDDGVLKVLLDDEAAGETGGIDLLAEFKTV